MDEPITYQVKVEGKLDACWSGWFNGLTIAYGRERDGSPTTTLTGTVTDQAALHGILVKIGYLNLPLISVNRVAPGSGDGL